MGKHINNLRDLEAYGIEALTGESCGIGYRILCDLTPRGAKIFRETFGLPADCKLADNWNSRGVASIMLPYDAWHSLAVFALFDSGCDTVIQWENRGYTGFDRSNPKDEERFQETLKLAKEPYGDKVERTFQLSRRPGNGLRDEHQMSGRVS